MSKIGCISKATGGKKGPDEMMKTAAVKAQNDSSKEEKKQGHGNV